MHNHFELESDENIWRFVASATYNKQWNSNNVQAAAIVGVNNNRPGHVLPAFLLEATGELHKKHLFFGRFEIVNMEVTPHLCSFYSFVWCRNSTVPSYIFVACEVLYLLASSIE